MRARAVAAMVLALLGSSAVVASEGPNPPAVHLRSRTLTAPLARDEALTALRVTQSEGYRHRLVQLRAVPDAEERAGLEQVGIRLLQYVPDNAWFASVRADIDPRAPVLDLLAASWAIEPADRTDPALATEIVRAGATDDRGRLRVKVLAFEDVDPRKLAGQLERIGATIDGVVGRLGLVFARLPEQRLAELGNVDGVHWIAAVAPEPGLEMNRPRAYLGTEHVHSAPYGLTGEGVEISVHELLGVGWHDDLAGRVVNADQHGTQEIHATKIAGTIAGDGTADPQYRGMAPRATILSYAWWGTPDMELDRALDITDALARGADVANNSWGYFCGDLPYGDYTAEASIYDRQVRGDDPWGDATGNPMSVVFSAGNERDGSGDDNVTDCIADTEPPFLNYGTLNQPKTAKNTMVVGGVDSADDRMSSFSGWGPTGDGRLKPDLVTAGLRHGTLESGVSVLYPQASMYYMAPTLGGGYDYFAMTSAAAAEATGNVALFIQDFRARNGGADPLPSTVKAFLVHSARDLDDATAWYNPGPDYASGWGVLDVRAAIDRLREGEWVEGCVAQGETDTYWIQVTEATGSVKVTLVWDDYPASPATSAPVLVSQLDLRVEDPAGARRFPWTLDPQTPGAPARRDRAQLLDNVEQVYVDAQVVPGLWTIRVDGTSLPMGSQCYSLVASKSIADEDTDGFHDDEECNDADSEINPIWFEACNAVDDDCDATVDEDCDSTCDNPRIDSQWPSAIVDQPAPGVYVTGLEMSWDWSDREVGFTWSDSRDGTTRTYFRRFGLGYGVGLWGFGDEYVVAEGGGAGVSWSGSEYGVANDEWFAPLHNVGYPIGPLRSTAGAGSRCAGPVWNGHHYAMIGWYEGDTRFSEFDREGRLVRSVVIDGCACPAQVQWTGAGYGGLTGTAQFCGLDPTGAPVSSASVPGSGAVPTGRARLAWNGAGYGVAWLDERTGVAQVYFRPVDPNGTALGPELALTADPLGVSGLDLVWTGQEYGLLRVVQEDIGGSVPVPWSVWFERFGADGASLGAAVRIDDDDTQNYAPRILWLGDRFGVAYQTLYTAYFRLLACCDDADADGFDECGVDCDDTVATVYPDAPEVCDGYRSDCGDPAWPTPPVDEQDGDEDGVSYCEGDCNAADPAARPGLPERCDAADNDCDGTLDEGCDTSCDAPRESEPEAILTPNAIQAADPRLVWNGNGYGLVWSDQRDGNAEIYFASLDSSMNKLSSDVRITNAPGSSVSPWIAWTGTEYGVAWQDDRDGNPRVFFVRLDRNGAQLDVDRAVAATESATSRLPRLVWTGLDYGLFWNDNRDGSWENLFRTISADGVTLGTPRMVSTPPFTSNACRAVWTGSGYGVAYNDNRTGDWEVYVAILDADGVRWNPEVRVTYSAGTSRSPAIEWLGGGFGVFWIDNRRGVDEIYYARLGPDGAKLGPEIPLAEATGVLPVHSVDWSGSEFGISWIDDRDGNLELYFQRVDVSGATIGAPLRITNEVASTQTPCMRWTGTDFGLVFVDGRRGNDELYRARIHCCTESIDGDADGANECIDCDDGDPATHPGAPESNDGRDNECSGDSGFGMVDEISGTLEFSEGTDKSRIVWPAQSGAVMYEIARSPYPDLHAACELTTTFDAELHDPAIPQTGTGFYYLVRSLVPNLGSWGQRSDGTERTVCEACESEGDACDDGDQCTTGDRCSAGTCLGAGPAEFAVVSQVQIDGASPADEFVELYNPLDFFWSLSGMTLQRRYGGFFYVLHRFEAADSIPPHGWFLVANPIYNGTVSPDARWNYGGDALWGNPFGDGAVLLVSDGTLVASCSDARVLDSVSWTTPCAEGAPVPTLPAPEHSVSRKPGWSCGNGQDTGDNATDFLPPGPSDPRNQFSAPLP